MNGKGIESAEYFAAGGEEEGSRLQHFKHEQTEQHSVDYKYIGSEAMQAHVLQILSI